MIVEVGAEEVGCCAVVVGSSQVSLGLLINQGEVFSVPSRTDGSKCVICVVASSKTRGSMSVVWGYVTSSEWER